MGIRVTFVQLIYHIHISQLKHKFFHSFCQYDVGSPNELLSFKENHCPLKFSFIFTTIERMKKKSKEVKIKK